MTAQPSQDSATDPDQTPAGQDPISRWGLVLEAAVCEACDWSFLLPQGGVPERCPHCFQAALSPLAGTLDRLPHVRPPEQVVPFTVTDEQLSQSIRRFARGIWFAPGT